jgi:squalene-associated FAD-dependent desaturase
LAAPLHLGFSFATFGALTLKERVAYSRAMLAMLRLGKDGRSRLADMSFGDWLNQHRQPASLVSKMYDPVLVGALNEDCRRASAAYAIQVFQDAMLANAAGYVMGVPRCPLSQLYDSFSSHSHGVHARLGARVESIRFEELRAAGVNLAGGESLPADAVVLATNYHSVQRWVPAELAKTDSRFVGLDQLESVPILGAHLWFDRPVLAEPHAALISGPLQWLFRKDAAGAAVHGVISAAREWVGRPKEQALQLFEQQVRSVLPAAREAKLLRGVIVIEKRATFAPVPGVDRLRPPQAPPPAGIASLYLAGDYTATGWPATMEGAVRSGYLAAERLLEDLMHQPQPFLQPDLPVQWPARILGL